MGNIQEQERRRNKNEKNKLVLEEKENRKTAEKENLKLKNNNISEHQKELKKRWVEYEEEKNFHKQAKKNEGLTGKLDKNQSTKHQKDECKKQIKGQIGMETTEISIT